MYNLLIILFLFVSFSAYSYEQRPMTERESKMFYRELQDELNKDEKLLVNHIKYPRVFDQHKLQMRMNVHKTKESLYKNFYGTPSVENKIVRRKLVEIFRKEIVEERDLLELHALVLKEKAKS